VSDAGGAAGFQSRPKRQSDQAEQIHVLPFLFEDGNRDDK